jgi:hypothetical protein
MRELILRDLDEARGEGLPEQGYYEDNDIVTWLALNEADEAAKPRKRRAMPTNHS